MAVIFVTALLVTGGLLAVYVPRWARFSVPVQRAVVGGYLLRLTLTLLLFGLTFAELPALKPYVAGPGLWRVFPDAAVYHMYGVDQRDAAQRGIDLRFPDAYPELVGGVYTHVGTSPLVLLLLNLVADITTLVLLLRLARKVTACEPPSWFAWGLVMWPSWALWSTQLLKDSLLLCVSVAAVSVAASIVERSESARLLWRYRLMEWPTLAALLVWISLSRPALGTVFVVALGLAFAAAALSAIRGRASAALVVVASLVVFTFYVQDRLAGRLYSVSGQTTAEGYLALGNVFEREEHRGKAIHAYEVALAGGDAITQPRARERLDALRSHAPMSGLPPEPSGAVDPAKPPSVVVGVLESPVRLPFRARLSRAVRGVVERLSDYRARFDLSQLEGLRQANLLGGSRFGENASVTTLKGLVQYFPVGLAHAAFTPFPWQLLRTEGGTGALKPLAVLELPWVYGIVFLGLFGAFRSLRSWNIGATFLAAFSVLGIIALAIVVPNDGLLFRYRLPMFATLAVFVLSAVNGLINRKAANRDRARPEKSARPEAGL